jgi:ribosomal protein S18 acetylase RimI-like enzyme
MMVAPIEGWTDTDVRVTDRLDEAFSAVFAAAGAGDVGDARERLEALGRIKPPRAFARLDAGGEAAAIGACAIEGDWAGVFAMRTDPRRRRQGLARRILSALMFRAGEEGATRAYLQVEADNGAALALYEAAGFAEAYRYRYWGKPATLLSHRERKGPTAGGKVRG